MVWVNLGAMESKNALKVREIIRLLEDWAPPVLQENYDNSGLIVGDRDAVINKVLVSLDCTEDVVAEAEAEGAGMIISHHPIVFKGLKTFTGASYVERTVMRAIKSGIAIYAIHTNLEAYLVAYRLNKNLGCLLHNSKKKSIGDIYTRFKYVSKISKDTWELISNHYENDEIFTKKNYDREI